MTFVVSSNKKEYLREFTGQLFSALPGITVYEQMNAEDAAECVKTHRISAVFIDGEWDAAHEFRLLSLLRQNNADLPVYVFAENDQYVEEALWNEATGYLLQPAEPEELKRLLAQLCPLA